jgi:hypothetical protein
MAFPEGWPPRPASGRRSIRFFIDTGVNATADFADNAYLFSDGISANTFKQTTTLTAGDEKKPTPVGAPDPIFDAGGSPLGTGRHPGDAYSFNPNLFMRQLGGATAFAFAGSTVTLTDPAPTRDFDRDLVGKDIRIQNATTGGNDGTFRISNVLSTRILTYENATGATESFAAGTDYRIRTISEAVPKEMIWAGTIRVINTGGGDLELSFDGVNVHGLVPSGESHTYRNRFEAGIAVRAAGVSFVIEAW